MSSPWWARNETEIFETGRSVGSGKSASGRVYRTPFRVTVFLVYSSNRHDLGGLSQFVDATDACLGSASHRECTDTDFKEVGGGTGVACQAKLVGEGLDETSKV